MSHYSVEPLSLPHELLALIVKFSISRSAKLINAESELEDPLSRRFTDDVWPQKQMDHIAASSHHRRWTLTLRLVSRTLNEVVQPLVLDRLTIPMDDLISGCDYVRQMLDDMAFDRQSSLTKYTKTLFLGSVYHRRTVRYEEREFIAKVEQEYPLQLEFSPSDPLSSVSRRPQAEAEVNEAELVHGSTLPVLVQLLHQVIRRLTDLRTFRWNMLSDGRHTPLWESITSALATLPRLSSVTFGLLDGHIFPPVQPLTFPTVHSLSLFVYVSENDKTYDLDHLVVKAAGLIRNFKFPAVQSLTVHCYDAMGENGGTFTVRDILQECFSDYIPPLKTLNLLNVPFIIDDFTTSYFTRLHSLNISFTGEVHPRTRACSGVFPITKNGGSTSLHSLTIHAKEDDSAFAIIPNSGLRHLSLVGFASSESRNVDLLTPERLGGILSGHVTTLESLALLPYSDIGQAWFEITMVPLLSEFTQLKHLAFRIEEIEDATLNTSESTMVTVMDSIFALPRPLSTLSIEIVLDTLGNLSEYLRRVRAIVVPQELSASHCYPKSVRLTIAMVPKSYQLQRSISGELKYETMGDKDMEDLISELPGGGRSALWGGRTGTHLYDD